MHALTLYFTFIKIRLKTFLEYRLAFLSGILAQLMAYGTSFLLIWVLIQRFQTLSGWTPYEVMVLYAMNLLSYALSAFFLFNFCIGLPEMVISGEFDEVLTKPLNPFFYIICRDVNWGYLSHLLLSILVLVLSFRHLEVRIHILSFAFLLLVIAGAAFIQGAALLFSGVLAFWIIRNSQSVREVLVHNLTEMTRYPISLYGKTIQVLFTLIIPYGFINFYPAQYFLNKSDFLMFHPSLQFFTPFVGALLFFLAYRFWIFGINQYSSTGS